MHLKSLAFRSGKTYHLGLANAMLVHTTCLHSEVKVIGPPTAYTHTNKHSFSIILSTIVIVVFLMH